MRLDALARWYGEKKTHRGGRETQRERERDRSLNNKIVAGICTVACQCPSIERRGPFFVSFLLGNTRKTQEAFLAYLLALVCHNQASRTESRGVGERKLTLDSVSCDERPQTLENNTTS